MSAQHTDQIFTAYRIGALNGKHPLYGDEGSRFYPGRWNKWSSPIVYCSQHYSTQILEKLVLANGVMPTDLHFITIIIPKGICYEKFQTAAHPGWDGESQRICQEFGDKWVRERRSTILFVPSIPARFGTNILVNLAHDASKAITYERPKPISWDDQLYRS